MCSWRRAVGRRVVLGACGVAAGWGCEGLNAKTGVVGRKGSNREGRRRNGRVKGLNRKVDVELNV